MAAQPARRGERETQGERTAPGGDKRGQETVAQHRRAKGIRHYEATFLGDEDRWKLVRNSEVEPIRELPVQRPFAVRAEIGDRALDLDDQEVARPAEREDVGATPVGEREFDKARIAELLERAADAACQGTGRGGLGGAHGAGRPPAGPRAAPGIG